MALISCPECGNQLSEKATSCPHCGYILRKSKMDLLKDNILRYKRLITIGLIVIACGIVVFAISTTRLNQYEQESLENCQALMETLKDPESFTLYDDILVYPCPDQNDENESEDDGDPLEYDALFYISYGAANSYGGMVREIAVFQDSTYMGNFSEIEEYTDFPSDDYEGALSALANMMSHEDELRAVIPYKHAKNSGDWEGFYYANADKIMKRLAN